MPRRGKMFVAKNEFRKRAPYRGATLTIKTKNKGTKNFQNKMNNEQNLELNVATDDAMKSCGW